MHYQTFIYEIVFKGQPLNVDTPPNKKQLKATIQNTHTNVYLYERGKKMIHLYVDIIMYNLQQWLLNLTELCILRRHF